MDSGKSFIKNVKKSKEKKNCYIVAARPDTPDKFKILLDNLKLIRKNSKCPIILSVNHYPSGIENWKDELYDQIIHCDINELEEGESRDVAYRFETDMFYLRTIGVESENVGGKYNDFGRAVNNLYLRGAQLAQTMGLNHFIFTNYDVEIKNKKSCDFLESKSSMFLENNFDSLTGEMFLYTWLFKLAEKDLQILIDLSSRENYNKIRFSINGSVGYYETIMWRYLEDKGLINIIKRIQTRDLPEMGVDLNCDMVFKGFRCFEDPNHGKVILLAEYIAATSDREVSVEFKGKVHTLGNIKGRWATIVLEKWFEGMYYHATINGRKYKRFIKKIDLDRTIITYK